MNKILVVSIDATSFTVGVTSQYPGINSLKVTMSEAEKLASPLTTVFGVDLSDIDEAPVNIGSVSVNNVLYRQVNNLVDLYLKDESFYYDFDNQTIHIVNALFAPLELTDEIRIGESTYLCSQAQIDNGYPIQSRFRDIYFDPRLIDNSVSISEQLDSQSYNILTYADLSFSILNPDGVYDNIRADIVGNYARIYTADIPNSKEEAHLMGIEYKKIIEWEDLKLRRFGRIDDVDFSNPNEPTILASDVRYSWNSKLGENLLTIEDFPLLQDNSINKRRPVALGPRDGIPTVQIDAVPEGADYRSVTFMICDTSYGNIQSINGVYFKGTYWYRGDLGDQVNIDRYIEEGVESLTDTTYEVDLVAGTLVVHNFVNGDIFVDGDFSPHTECVDIITYLLDRHASIAYNDFNYNIKEMEYIRSLGYNTSVYVDSNGTDLNTILEKIVSDLKLHFFQQDTVLRMIRANEEKAAIEIVEFYECEENPSSWSTNRTTTIKTINVNYKPNLRTEQSLTFVDNSKEEESVKRLLTATDGTFDIDVYESATVEEIYARYYERFSEPIRFITFKRMYALQFAGLGDFIHFTVSRNVSIWEEKIIFPKSNYKVISINHKDDTITAEFFSLVGTFDTYTQGFLPGTYLAGSFLGGATLGKREI